MALNWARIIESMNRAMIWLFAWAFFASIVFAKGQSGKPRPDFKDYPVQHVYRGKPAPPVLNKAQRMFRTAIRRGAYVPVQLAGHYTVPAWGCGAGCIVFDIVDSVSGRVYDGYAVVLPLDWLDEHEGADWRTIEYRPNSQLFKINGCLGETGPCGFYDYLMVPGKGLKLIRKELLPEKYQVQPGSN